MPNYRRYRVAGGCYFFTVTLLERRNGAILCERIEALREAVRAVRAKRPFHIDAWVVLPDHLHALWTLPPGDDDFSTRWRLIKSHFARSIPQQERRSAVRRERGERAIWSRRFWEHGIRDENDYARHFDYIHYNPVKHGHVPEVAGWPHSTFHRAVRQGIYPIDWGTAPGDDFPTGE
ncbi:REP-associated tyrosine transposase [Endothiovibrio diazotrophicus]